MSSTERAPEPTMEDILASIRRIITDDDVSQAPVEKPAEVAQAEDESLEGEADNQIIDDIARVLSAGGEAPPDDEEVVMDLAAELGGLELVEDEPEELAEAAEVVVAAPEFVEVSEEIEEVLELEDVQPDILEPEPVAEVNEMVPPPLPPRACHG